MSAGRPLPTPDPAWAYFLDLDGTLVPLARSPDAVRIDPALRRLVEEVHAFAGEALALITGRPIAEVDRFFPGLRLPVAGQHGLERRAASGALTTVAFPDPQLDAVRRRLATAIARHPGLVVEDKGLSVALHYRKAPTLAGYAHRLARAQLHHLAAGYTVRTGKRVVEIAPAGTDKGEAIRAFMTEAPFRGRVPVFLGDDMTDEHGFAMVNRLGGTSIKVGTGATTASWRLRDVAAVRRWLRRGRRPAGSVR